MSVTRNTHTLDWHVRWSDGEIIFRTRREAFAFARNNA